MDEDFGSKSAISVPLCPICHSRFSVHYSDVIMNEMASQITNLTIVYSGADKRKHQSSASLALVRGIRRWPVNCPHKGSTTRTIFSFDDVIMVLALASVRQGHSKFERLSSIYDHFSITSVLTWPTISLKANIPVCIYDIYSYKVQWWSTIILSPMSCRNFAFSFFPTTDPIVPFHKDFFP